MLILHMKIQTRMQKGFDSIVLQLGKSDLLGNVSHPIGAGRVQGGPRIFILLIYIRAMGDQNLNYC